MQIQKTYPVFRDRQDAGEQLAEKLERYADSDPAIFAIPSGGVAVAAEIAGRLKTSLDVIIVRKIPIPQEPEAGYGAVTDDGTLVLNKPLVKSLGLTGDEIKAGAERVKLELAHRVKLFRGNRPFPYLEDKTTIVVDDGLASGFTMIAAIRSLRSHGAKNLVAAVPASSRIAFNRVNTECDELISLVVSETSRFAVASFYENWYDIPEDEVIKILEDINLRARREKIKK